MRRRHVLHAGAAVTLVSSPSPSRAKQPAPEPLEPLLAPHLAGHGLPALAAAVVAGGRVVAAGAVGTRRLGTDTPVTREDRFHIGSDTKAMTATLAGMAVEAGALRWEMTIAEAFPELVPRMDARRGGVTLVQLLSHTSGQGADDAAFLDLILRSYGAGPDDSLNLDEMRAWIVGQVAAQPLAAAPGSRFVYANMNYVVAGAMVERALRATWEELVTQRIFDPLGLATAGIGPQSSVGRVDAPLGHARRPDGTLKPMLAGPNGDIPLVLAPAGLVHLSILDFATWVGWNAGQGRRPPSLLRPETLRALHTPRIRIELPPAAPTGPPRAGGYALGWGEAALPYSRLPFVTHSGSNTMNCATALLQPEADWGMVLATNVGGADPALQAIAAEIYGRFGPARAG